MKYVLMFSMLLSLALPAAAQVNDQTGQQPFSTRVSGNFIDVFAPNYKMEPDQRFERRDIFEVARAYCLTLNAGTRLMSHEPAVYVMKTGSIHGTSFKYRCKR